MIFLENVQLQIEANKHVRIMERIYTFTVALSYQAVKIQKGSHLNQLGRRGRGPGGMVSGNRGEGKGQWSGRSRLWTRKTS